MILGGSGYCSCYMCGKFGAPILKSKAMRSRIVLGDHESQDQDYDSSFDTAYKARPKKETQFRTFLELYNNEN